MAVDPEEPFVIAGEGKSTPGKSNGLDAGSGFEFGLDIAECGANGIGIRIHPRGRKRKAEGKDFAGIETGIDVVESGEGANHEAGTEEKDEGKRNLGGNENALKAGALAIEAAAAFLKSLVRIAAGGAKGGRQAEEDARGKREKKSEEEDADVHANFAGAG